MSKAVRITGGIIPYLRRNPVPMEPTLEKSEWLDLLDAVFKKPKAGTLYRIYNHETGQWEEHKFGE